MNWTTTNVELDDNEAQVRGIYMNELAVRGGNLSYKSAKQSTSTILIATVFFLFFPSSSSRVSPFLYTTFLLSSLPYTWIVNGLY